jgi:hypothetical protein
VKYKNCYDYLTPYWTRSGNTYTGLTAEDAQRLGSMLGINLFPSSKYWDNFFVRVGADDVFLETEDPLDEIKYLFLKNHRRIKTSLFEHKATADYLLINKDEEAKRENLFNKAKVDAIYEFKRMSLTDMRKCLRLFGQNGENVSGEVVENSMFKIVEANPSLFLEKWVNNKNREIEVVIEQAISRNIIRRNKNVYKFGSEVIGYSLQEVIDFLNTPKNQDIKLSILSSIDTKDFMLQNTLPEEQEEDKPIKAVSNTRIKKPVVSAIKLGDEDVDAVDINKLDFTTQE